MSQVSRYLEAALQRVIVFDGAMGTMIQNLGLEAADYGGESVEGCPEILVLSRPDAIRDIHRAYLAAGAGVDDPPAGSSRAQAVALGPVARAGTRAALRRIPERKGQARARRVPRVQLARLARLRDRRPR